MYRLCQVSSEAEPDGVVNIYNPLPRRLRLEGCRFKANLDCLARVYGECKDTMLVSPTLAPRGPLTVAVGGRWVIRAEEKCRICL